MSVHGLHLSPAAVAPLFARTALAVAGFALAYLLVRFALLALVGRATGAREELPARYGPTAVKVVAFVDALVVPANVFSLDVPVEVPAAVTLVFVLATLTYWFERRMATRTGVP